jgi:predicted N-acetyltransferase YhbS
MKYDIIHLNKEKWKGTILPIGYTTDSYYDVLVSTQNHEYFVHIEKKLFSEPIKHSPEDYDFPDKLYEDYWENAYAWGVVLDDLLIAAIETCPETWSNRLRVTELWVDERYRRLGIGHALMDIAKEQARLERRRAIILETQSCNVNAIEFYQSEGFSLIGFDSCAYKNNDIDRKEVRLEFGWFPKLKKRFKREDIEIRMETKDEYHQVEEMTMRAFWNKFKPGCDEHYLVHQLRQDSSYLPSISRIALYQGEIIGCIMYSKSKVIDGDSTHEVITFGPLCVDPLYQGCGVGELLMKETIELAKNEGYKGIVIFGEPDYYPRFGFVNCDNYHITTKDSQNFDAFMAYELIPGGLANVRGKFYEAEVFEHLPEIEIVAFNLQFSKLKKINFPGQWEAK